MCLNCLNLTKALLGIETSKFGEGAAYCVECLNLTKALLGIETIYIPLHLQPLECLNLTKALLGVSAQ